MSRMQTEEMRRQIRDAVYHSLDFSRDTTDEEMYALIDEKIAAGTSRGVTVDERRRLRRDVFSSIRELDVLQPLLDDPAVTDVKTEARIQYKVEKPL